MEYRVICIGGPTGAGKDTIASMFLEQCPGFIRIPRSTTRQPRHNEIPGFHYFFLSDHTFMIRERMGTLCGIDHFCGYRYGIDHHSIVDVLTQHKNVLGIFGIKGLELRFLLPEPMISIYITAPLQTLYEHLTYRGDSIEEISIRMVAAEKQIADELHLFDHVIYNVGTVAEAVRSFVKIVS